jgi:hypothetical protein
VVLDAPLRHVIGPEVEHVGGVADRPDLLGRHLVIPAVVGGSAVVVMVCSFVVCAK